MNAKRGISLKTAYKLLLEVLKMKNYDICEICGKRIYRGEEGWICGCGRLVCLDCIDAEGDCLECERIKS